MVVRFAQSFLLDDFVMETRIDLERRGRKPSEIIELNLDNCRATSISGLTEEFSSLVTLSLINVGLTSLKGLPPLPALKTLEASENRISGGLECLHVCPELQYINLSGNKIKEISALAPLNELKHLKSLDLFNCEVSSTENYRDEVFKTLPNLKYLDGFDANDEEAESDEEITGEGDEDTGGEESDDEEDASELGVEYLNSSAAMEDEDETEDYNVSDEDSCASDGARGTKRKHEEEED